MKKLLILVIAFAVIGLLVEMVYLNINTEILPGVLAHSCPSGTIEVIRGTSVTCSSVEGCPEGQIELICGSERICCEDLPCGCP